MKKILVIAAMTAFISVASAQQPGVTIYMTDGTTSTVTIGGSSSKTCVPLCTCSRHKTKKVVGPTYTWTPAPGTSTVAANTVREVVVQQPVVVQPTYVVQQSYQPRYSGWYAETPGRVWGMTFPFVASAGIGISTYPSPYYSGTYWQYDSRCQERYNMAATRYGYGGRQSVGHGFNNNPYGSVPSVGQMFNHGNRRR